MPVVTRLASGCPPAASVAAFGLDARTVAAWPQRAGRHSERIQQALVEPPHALAPGHADDRRPSRRAAWWSAVRFALGGEAGARLCGILGLAGRPDRRLVRIRRLPLGGTRRGAAPRVLGGDDFARRRGHASGPRLVDRERHRPVDALPERPAGPLAAGLRAHPGGAVISRDRRGDDGEGARQGGQGAPHAVQVADRFPRVQHLGEVVERVRARACEPAEQRTMRYT